MHRREWGGSCQIANRAKAAEVYALADEKAEMATAGVPDAGLQKTTGGQIGNGGVVVVQRVRRQAGARQHPGRIDLHLPQQAKRGRQRADPLRSFVRRIHA